MKTFDKGSIPKTGADILQNWHHIRTQSADIHELSEIARRRLTEEMIWKKYL